VEPRHTKGRTKNRVLVKIFGPRREEATGGWRQQPSGEELHDLYRSPTIQLNQITEVTVGQACGTHGGECIRGSGRET
jgi:hypothetical protein